MKTLQELPIEELRELARKNQEFSNKVYEDAYANNMDVLNDEFDLVGASVFDYHDHYSSFYLTTPTHYGVRDGHAVAHKLNDEYMSQISRALYDKLNKLADEYENLEADELDERGDDLEEQMSDVCDNLAEHLTSEFRAYENVSEDDFDNILRLIADGDYYMSEWETDGTKVYEHITKEYK